MRRGRGDGVSLAAVLLGAGLAWAGTAWTVAWAAERAAAEAAGAVVAALRVLEAAAGAETSGAPAPTGHSAGEAVRPPDPPSEGVAFRASSLGGGFVVQGDYAGWAEWAAGTLRVRVSRARVTRPWGFEGAPYRLVGVRLSLAEATDDGWRFVRRGELHPVEVPMGEGDGVGLDSMALDLDLQPEEAGGRWLVIEHELATMGDAAEKRSWTYAHAPMELLSLLFELAEYTGC